MGQDNSQLNRSVKEMIIRSLKLKVTPEKIVDDAPLFGSGLGLDSVDALELVIAIEKEFGARIPDATVGAKVLVSVNTIAEYIKEQGNKG